jgi:5-methylcytosine-specific restriction endonuclease McrA
LEEDVARQFAKPFYNSKEWKSVREYCLKRDNLLCQMCGNPAEEVHHKVHLTPQNITNMEIALNPNNLISLCGDCHKGIHLGDKITGLKARGNNSCCADEYEFDENGQLIRVSQLPPSKNF